MPWDHTAPGRAQLRRPAVHHDHVTRAGVLAGLMVLTVLTALTGCTGPGTADVPVADQPARIVAATNEARAAEGLEPLTPSDCATQVAAARATALIGAAALEHAPLDDVLTGCGVSAAGENLSRATVPRTTLDAQVRSQAERGVAAQFPAVVNSMRLEAQHVSEYAARDTYADLVDEVIDDRGLWSRV